MANLTYPSQTRSSYGLHTAMTRRRCALLPDEEAIVEALYTR
uniref:Uncharacterized protein n=1 Tax=Siphoviridae sp. ctmpG14 TaxID=2825654 RepID=A0A8S5PDA2_9CAUD|nr:MAG TPA: hypothetical protein [Siphoviridae sp. ctmpG14]